MGVPGLSNPEILAGRTFTVPPERRNRIVSVVLQHVDPARPLRVLDLGCGTALNALALAEALPHASVSGVDLSSASIAQGEAASRRHPAGARVTLTAANYLQVLGGPFDVIVSDTVLYAIPAPDEALFGKIAGDLAPGGLLVYTMPTNALANRLVVALRRVLKRMRGRRTDALLLAIARALHGGRYDDALLRERVPYMYVVPDRYDSRALHARLRERWGFEILATEPIPRASPAQLKHRLVVARRPR
ncbi:MAG TPA: class I SAM-dependent methyltransferase [Candidatus Binatia bacterium]|nr:class I SAM-dependent methyltransferase [Candidatus Binatia bacterium]